MKQSLACEQLFPFSCIFTTLVHALSSVETGTPNFDLSGRNLALGIELRY